MTLHFAISALFILKEGGGVRVFPVVSLVGVVLRWAPLYLALAPRIARVLPKAVLLFRAGDEGFVAVMETVGGTAGMSVEEGQIGRGDAGHVAPGAAVAAKAGKEEEGQEQEPEDRRLPTKIQQGLENLERAKEWVLGGGGGPGVSIGDVSTAV